MGLGSNTEREEVGSHFHVCWAAIETPLQYFLPRPFANKTKVTNL